MAPGVENEYPDEVEARYDCIVVLRQSRKLIHAYEKRLVPDKPFRSNWNGRWYS